MDQSELGSPRTNEVLTINYHYFNVEFIDELRERRNESY